MTMTKFLAIVLYLSVMMAYIISLRGLADFHKHVRKDVVASIAVEIKEMANFRQYFFTLWNFVLQLVFLTTAILDECSKLLGLPLNVQKNLGRTRAFLFNALLFPSSLLVMTVFWSLWHIDRELIFPKVLDEFFPNWLNHTLHSLIAVPLLIEIVLPKKYNFVVFRNVAVVLIMYTTIYQLLFVSVYLRHGIWLYPVYKDMNWPQRLLFSLLLLGLALVYQKIGIVVQNRKKIKEIKVK